MRVLATIVAAFALAAPVSAAQDPVPAPLPNFEAFQLRQYLDQLHDWLESYALTCAGPAEVVEWASGGVPACIATPAGGTDTTCLDAGVACLFAASASEGGAATTALALDANGTNCGAGDAAAGVDASGNAEGCFTPGGEPTGTADTAAFFDSDGVGLVSEADILLNGSDLEVQEPSRLCFPAGAGSLPICLSGWIDGYLQIERDTTDWFIIGAEMLKGAGFGAGGIKYQGASATSPSLFPHANETNSGIGRAAAGDLSLITTGTHTGGWRKEGAALVVYSEEYLQTKPISTPVTCDSAMEGAEYYDSDINEKCFCNGTAWNQIDGGGAC